MKPQLRLPFFPEKERTDTYQYMFLANLDTAVQEGVSGEKKTFKEKLPGIKAIITPPHITLLHFWAELSFSARTKLEFQLSQFIHGVCLQQYSFPVELENFGGFDSGVIYICVQNQEAFADLQSDLRGINTVLKAGGCNYARMTNCLHVTVARGLDKNVFERILTLYSRRRFHAFFLLKKLTLVRRSIHENHYQHIKDFYLFTERTLFN